MITNYTLNEIEHTLYLYPIAKIKVKEIEMGNQKTTSGSIKLHHYLFITRISEYWLSTCKNDEIEIIQLRFFEHKSYDYISIQLGYKNHSSVIRKINTILKKISEVAN